MSARPVIVFEKRPGDRHAVTVTGRRGPDVHLADRGTAQRIPHDLVHAVVESTLGITDGFWGSILAGATYGGFRHTERGRHRASGSKALRRLGDRVMEAELLVGHVYRVWTGRPVDPQFVPSLDERRLARALAALDDATARWDALAEGDTLTWVWPLALPGRTR